MHIIRVFLRVSAYDTFYDMLAWLAKKQKNKKKNMPTKTYFYYGGLGHKCPGNDFE